MILKVTIVRSNPQCIRKIRCSEKLTPAELAGVVCIAFGFRPCEFKNIYGISSEMGEGSCIGDMFTGDIYNAVLENCEGIIFRIEVSTRDESVTNKTAELIDSRGYMVPQPENTDILNGMFYAWENGQAVYIEKKKLWTRGYEFSPNHSKINNMIIRFLNNELQTNTFTHRFDCPYRLLVRTHTESELENLCRAEGFRISPYHSKMDLERVLEKELTKPQFFKWYLMNCSLTEYEALRELFYQEKKDYNRENELFSRLIYLKSFFLVDIDAKRISTEFAEYMENILEEEGDNEILYVKRVNMVISGCVRLYGVVPIFWARDLFAKYFPGEDNGERFVTAWRDYAMSPAYTACEIISPTCLYDANCISEYDAELMAAEDRRDEKKYAPSLEELDSIAERGVPFEDKYQKKIVMLLATNVNSLYAARKLTYEIAECIHMGESVDEIIPRIRMENRLNRQVADKLKELVDEAWKTVRLIRLNGFTEDEYSKR